MRDLPCLWWTVHILPSLSSELMTQSWSRSRWKSHTLHRSLTKEKYYSRNEHFPGWVTDLSKPGALLLRRACQPPASTASSPEPGFPPAPAAAWGRSENLTVLLAGWKAESSHSGSPNLNADTFAASDLCDTSQSANKTSAITLAGREGHRLRRKCIFSTSHQPNYQLSSFAESF